MQQQEQISKLNNFLQAFKIKGECVSFNVCGRAKRYEVSLELSEKLSKLEKHTNELALYLKHGSRPNTKMMLDTGTVAIEFVDKSCDNSTIKDYKFNQTNTIRCVLGQDVYGNTVEVDITNSPHMIISGCTGSGKSSGIHTIIANLLSNYSNSIYLIDPKRIEFAAYKEILNCRVGHTYQDTISILDLLHYRMKINLEKIENGTPIEKIPASIIIIDEFADLIFQDQDKSLYNKLCTLAQKCRAAKIHIILATQRPSSTIIDGNIKANFPTRLAFKATSKVDSKIILDDAGAEELYGRGEAIFKSFEGVQARLQVAYANPSMVKEIYGY